jgi:hypothetical protein
MSGGCKYYYDVCLLINNLLIKWAEFAVVCRRLSLPKVMPTNTITAVQAPRTKVLFKTLGELLLEVALLKAQMYQSVTKIW